VIDSYGERLSNLELALGEAFKTQC
jgi:hypothetical protein